MSEEGPSLKVILYVFSLYSTVMMGLVGWIGLTEVESGRAIQAIHTELTIQIPRILSQQEVFKKEIAINKFNILELQKSSLPSVARTLAEHIQHHPDPVPKKGSWDSSHIMGNEKNEGRTKRASEYTEDVWPSKR